VFYRLIKWTLIVLLWPLAAIGLIVIVLAILIASPVKQPPGNTEILSAVKALDRLEMPATTRFQARDGTELAYRLYPAEGEESDIVAVAIHGSAGSSTGLNAVSKALADAGVAVAAPDIRGHGFSGNRGDIGYIGQLEDDLGDLLSELRKRFDGKRFVLVGYSSGGGFALKVAASPVGKDFDRFVLLAPYLGPFSPTSRDLEEDEAWASPDVPRIIGLDILRQAGVECCEGLPAISFNLPPEQTRLATRIYSYRLLTNFTAPEDYEAAFAKASGPVVVLAGEDDDLMDSGQYANVVDDVQPPVEVEVFPGIDHMEIVSDAAALDAVVAAVKGD